MSDNHVPTGTGAAMSPDLGESKQPALPHQVHEASTPRVQQEPVVRIKAVPLSGFGMVLYKVMAAFGIRLLMKRSRKDRKILDEKHHEALLINVALNEENRRILNEKHQEALLINAALEEEKRRKEVRVRTKVELRNMTDLVPSAVVAFFNTKGAASTTTNTVHFSAVLAEISRNIVTLVDGNPAAGTAAGRLGKNHGDTVTIQSLASDLKGDVDIDRRRPKEEMAKARPSVNGVRVVSADSIIEEQRRLSGEGMSNVLRLLSSLSEFVTIDTANDIGDVPMKEVAKKADVFVFTANVAIPDSLRQLATSMEAMRKLGYDDKVNKSVVVISNIPHGEELAQYRKFLNEVNFEDEVVRVLEHLFDGVFMGVYHDSYIALDRTVDLERLDWRTMQAYINMVISVLKQVQELRPTQSLPGRVTPFPVHHTP